jgi:hypothetical protein
MFSIPPMPPDLLKYHDDLTARYYFRNGGEPEGEWCGGASHLGLVGIVRPEPFRDTSTSSTSLDSGPSPESRSS